MGVMLDQPKAVVIILITSGLLLLIAGAAMPDKVQEILQTLGIILIALLFPVAMLLWGAHLVTA